MDLYFIAIWKMALAAPTNLKCSIMVSIYYRSTYPALEQKNIDDSNGQKDLRRGIVPYFFVTVIAIVTVIMISAMFTF